MRYYTNTSTQEKPKEGSEVYNEYGKKETTGTGEDAKKTALANIHNSYATQIKSDAIQYWCGKVEDTKGNVIEKLEVGEYVEQPEA